MSRHQRILLVLASLASPTVASAQTELPNTASPLALYGLLGLFSLGGAAALRFRR